MNKLFKEYEISEDVENNLTPLLEELRSFKHINIVIGEFFNFFINEGVDCKRILSDSIRENCSVNARSVATVGASKVIISLNPSDGFISFVAAMRACDNHLASIKESVEHE